MLTEIFNAEEGSENELSRPCDLALVLSNLHAEDALNQNAALQAVTFAPDSLSDEEGQFHMQVPKSRSLKLFKKLYSMQKWELAIDLLSNRMKVDFWWDKLLTALDSTDIAWNINEHFVDMMVCVGRGLGLGLIIPNQEVNLLYQINLDFGHRHCVFHAKYAKLGFCGNNSLLWIGKTVSSEDIWIAWAPEERGEE